MILNSGAVLHLAAHVAVPAVVALIAHKRWPSQSAMKVFVLMMAAMVIDVDHLLATPVFDPQRCGIGFHPLHSAPAMVVYAVMLFFRPVRWIAIGLWIHMALDSIDCLRVLQ